MEKFLNEDVTSQLRDVFKEMKNSINILLFTDGKAETGAETAQLLGEVAALSELIKLEVIDPNEDKEKAKKYDISLLPTFVFLDHEHNYKGVKFSGFPGGHEINSFVTAIMEMSGHEFAFSSDVLARIDKINKPVDIKVFVTLSCPHCPGAVETAHRLAMRNPNIKGVMIEAQTFNELSNKHKVSSVPKIVINDKYEFLGNQPVEVFLKQIEAL